MVIVYYTIYYLIGPFGEAKGSGYPVLESYRILKMGPSGAQFLGALRCELCGGNRGLRPLPPTPPGCTLVINQGAEGEGGELPFADAKALAFANAKVRGGSAPYN